MAEAHPVGFQWVMEAKARGAKVIHVDPRFTRTSAVADTYVPIRAGTDIAFLGGVINYILTNDLDFREYVAAYTNAAILISRGVPGHRGPRRAVQRLRRRHGDVRPRQLAVPGRGPGRSDDTGDSAEHKEQTAPAAARSRRAHRWSRPPTASPQDPTLQDPRCVFQILKRHFARYTPEMVERVCGTPPEQFRAVCEAWTAQLGPRAHGGAGLQRRLDAAQRRRAVHPRRRDHPAAAGQHRPAGRRRLRAARARQHPGLDGHPDAVQPAARLPADAAAPSRTTTSPPTWTPSAAARRRASGPRPTPTWCRCSRSTSASTPRPRTTSASTSCRGSTATTARTARSWTWSTAARCSATSCSGRTRPSARHTASCSAWAWRTSTGWSSATSP